MAENLDLTKWLNLDKLTPPQVDALNDTLTAAGYDVGGKGMGDKTRTAYQQWWAQKQGEASTRTDTLNAEAAKTNADAALLAAEAAKAKQESEDDPIEQAKKIGILGGPALAGYAGGVYYGNKLGKAFESKQLQNNNSLSDLAARISQELSRKGGPRTLQLHGMVSSGKSLGLNKVKGPLGILGMGGFMAGEGALSRIYGSQQEPGWGKDIINGIGTGSIVAGGTTIAHRALRRGLEGVNPDPNALATLLEAEARLDPNIRVGSVADRPQPVAPKAPAPVKAQKPTAAQIKAAHEFGIKTPGWYKTKEQLNIALRKAGGPTFLMPLMAAIAASAAARDARASGQDGMGQAGAAAGAGVDVASMGATGAYGRAREAGYGVPGSVAAGAGAAVDNLTTGGMAQTMLDPEVDPEFKRTASANMALPTGSPLNASAAMGVDADAIRKALAYLLSGPAPR